MPHISPAQTQGDGLNVLWFLPTHGDGRYLGTSLGARETDIDYLRQVAQAADRLGYYGVLIPTGKSCEDSWLVASALAPATKRLRYLVAVRPGLASPTLYARMTATLDRISDGRLLINIVTGGDPVENAGDGIFLNHDERYEVTDEFLTVYRRLLAGEHVTYFGKHIKVDDAHLLFPPLQENGPALYFGGSSEAANKVAAEHVDKYLTWGEPPAAVEAKIKQVRALAEAEGRKVSFGIRLHVIARETDAKAWEAADELIGHLDDATIAAAQKVFSRLDSVGQSRMQALHGGRRDKLEVSPNLWAGVGLVRGGAGTALVGSGQTVAARMQEYADLGIDSFILSGYPHLEEAYRVAELVLPRLKLNHTLAKPSGTVNTGPFGETIANDYRPAPRAAQS